MNLINAQRKAIQYYTDLHEKEKNPIKRFLLKKEIWKSQKDLSRLLKAKKTDL